MLPPPEPAGIALRPLLAADLPAASGLSYGFGWPHRLDDWAFMLSLGQGVAAEQDGTLVGTGMIWAYGGAHAALGMVGVAETLQNKGVGRAVMARLLALAGPRAIVLHATTAGEPLYRRLDFVTAGTVRQFEGATSRTDLQPLAEGERLRPIGRSDPAALAALDRDATGMDRGPLIAALLSAGTAIILDRSGTPSGFAVTRRFGRGDVIGPVVAPDVAGARALIAHCLAERAGQFVRIDVPEAGDLAPWLAEQGLNDAGPALRMVRGPASRPAGRARTFAIASQAFG
jgi:GNAT superfamily N-acetyltransferase